MNYLFLVETIFASLLGVHCTYWLAHQKNMDVIRAASLSSLVFVLIAHFSHNAVLLSLEPAFFGSTFVAMTEPFRLSEKKVLVAGFAFGIILFGLQQIDFLHFHGGIGGTLGGTAFLACMLIYWIERLFLKSL